MGRRPVEAADAAGREDLAADGDDGEDDEGEEGAEGTTEDGGPRR